MATESAVFIEPLVGHEYQKLTYRLAWARKQYEINKSQVQDREYAGHSYDDWTILRESISAFKARMLSEHVLKLGPELNRLLISEAGLVENGFCADYTASLTRFPPSCTMEAIDRWFNWHSVEKAGYTLWFSHAHISAIAQNRTSQV